VSAAGPFTATLFDGRTARPHTAAVTVDGAGVHITVADPERGGSGPVLWPAATVRLVARYRADEPLRLSYDGDAAAWLTIRDLAAHAALLAHCPNLRRRRGGWRTHWRPILLWSGGAVASLALLLLFGVPWLADLVVRLIPPAQEAAWGETLVDEVAGALAHRPGAAGPRFCETPAGRAALDRLTARLAAGADLPLPLTVRVLAMPQANAFALPGGQILILSGLIDEAADGAEVAGVLAHEIGHVAYRHPLEQAVEQLGLATLLGLLIGDVSGSTVIVIGTTTLLQSSYTRDAERAADDFGVGLLNRADIAGASLAGFFDRAVAESGPGEQVPVSVSTHPASPDRAAAIRAAATGSGPAMSDADWQALRDMCDE
jgi:Zn-dependent protease with chaperone function